MIMVYNAACKYFGYKQKYEISDFLPPPTVPQIKIEKAGADQQAILYETVQQVYCINRDDFNTREIAMVEPEKRAKFFDDLRKNYPVRREFQNTEIAATEATEFTESLSKKLKGIGFRVKSDK
jgi:erythronate-4-phosphate dehydrogenase